MKFLTNDGCEYDIENCKLIEDMYKEFKSIPQVDISSDYVKYLIDFIKNNEILINKNELINTCNKLFYAVNYLNYKPKDKIIFDMSMFVVKAIIAVTN